MIDRKNGLTYADSGVDIDAGNRMVDLIKPLVRATARAGADAEIGGVRGLFYFRRAGFPRSVSVSATDRGCAQGKVSIYNRHPRAHSLYPVRPSGEDTP